jgi:hypothetical protein
MARPFVLGQAIPGGRVFIDDYGNQVAVPQEHIDPVYLEESPALGPTPVPAATHVAPAPRGPAYTQPQALVAEQLAAGQAQDANAQDLAAREAVTQELMRRGEIRPLAPQGAVPTAAPNAAVPGGTLGSYGAPTGQTMEGPTGSGYGRGHAAVDLRGIGQVGPGNPGLRPDQQVPGEWSDIESQVTAEAQRAREPIMRQQEELAAEIEPDLGGLRGTHRQQAADEAARIPEQVALMGQARQRFRDAVASGIDPNRVFSTGTVSQAQAVMAGMASALWGNQMGEADPMRVLNGIIDRDIAAQEAGIKNAGAELNFSVDALERQLGSRAAAQATYRNAILDFAANQAEALARRVGTVDAQEKAKRTIIAIQREQAVNDSKAIDANRKEAIDVSQANANLDMSKAKLLQEQMDTAAGMEEPKWDDYKDEKKQWLANVSVLRLANQLRELRDDISNKNPGKGLMDVLLNQIPGEQHSEGKLYDSLLKQLVMAIQKAHSGAASTDQEYERIQGMFNQWDEGRHRIAMDALFRHSQGLVENAEAGMGSDRAAWLRRQSDTSSRRKPYDPGVGSQVGFTPK